MVIRRIVLDGNAVPCHFAHGIGLRFRLICGNLRDSGALSKPPIDLLLGGIVAKIDEQPDDRCQIFAERQQAL